MYCIYKQADINSSYVNLDYPCTSPTYLQCPSIVPANYINPPGIVCLQCNKDATMLVWYYVFKKRKRIQLGTMCRDVLRT